LSTWGCCGPGALAGSNQAGLWQATPAGEWQRLDSGCFERTDLTGLAQVDGRLYAAGALGLFESAAGQRWQKIAGLPGVMTDLVIDPADPARWLAGTPAGLYRSQDRGRSWTAVSPPWTVWDLAWGPQGRLFVGRANGLAWTDRPGAESIPWQEADGMGRVAFLRVRPHPTDPATVWSGTWGNNIGVSDDGGEEVEPLHNGLETLTGLDVLWLPRPGQVLLATGEGVYRSQDGGQSWGRLPGPLSQQTVYALLHTPDGTLWAGAADRLWSSRDGGESWGEVSDLSGLTVLRVGQLTFPWPPPAIPFTHEPLVYGPPRWLWAGTEGAGVWVSRDNGVTWSLAGLPARTVYNLQLQDRLLAATDRGIWAATIPESLLAGK
jgi:ligand-binding sensor domain-containing protein